MDHKKSFSNAHLGKPINEPIEWLFTTKNKKTDTQQNCGDRQSIITLIKLMYDSTRNSYKRTSEKIYVDENGNHFANANTGHNIGGKLMTLDIDKEMQQIRRKYNIK